MKYLVVLYDGMADYPVPALDGKTPMELAKKPLLDKLARFGKVGTVKTVADGLKPGSDIANMSVLGYNPKECYTGRSPLEAVSIGVDMKDTDIIFRTNLVTLSDEENYEDKTMVDYSAGDISTAEAAEIIKSVQEHFGNEKFAFYSGVAYRHCLVWNNGTLDLGKMTPPHDISGKVIGEHLSKSENAKELIQMMKESYDFLMEHPVNKEWQRANALLTQYGSGARELNLHFPISKRNTALTVQLFPQLTFLKVLQNAQVWAHPMLRAQQAT